MKKIFYISLIMILAGFTSQAQERREEEFRTRSLKVYEENERVYIDWEADSTEVINYFEVQRSIGGEEFRTIGLVMGPDPKQEGEQYRFVEKIKNRTNKTISYRICQVDTNGHKKTTKIIQPTK